MSALHDLLTITDAVDALTTARTNREPVRRLTQHNTVINEHHTTHVPPLLDQLQESLEPGGTADSGRSVPASRPSARIDAIDTYHRIDQSAYNWCKTYATDRRWDDLTDKLRALVGVASLIEADELHELALETRRWASWARVVTGWEIPPWRPANTCPLCGMKGGLRVRVEEMYGACLDCGESWQPETITLLADHIRAENGDELRDQEAS